MLCVMATPYGYVSRLYRFQELNRILGNLVKYNPSGSGSELKVRSDVVRYLTDHTNFFQFRS